MTVPSTQNRKTFAGDSVTTSFGTSPIIFFQTTDLQLFVTVTATGASTALTLGTHYTVTGGAGAIGTVNLAGGSTPWGALQTGTTLVILRELPLTQEDDFVNNSASDAEVAERAFDRLVMIAQRLDERLGRSFALPDSDVSGASTELPSPQGSRIIGWNSGGTALVNYAAGDIAPDILVSAFMLTVLDDANAATARATLDVPSNAEALLDTIIAAKGDLITGTANDTPAILTAGSSGRVLMARSADAKGLAYAAALNKGIYGLTYANNGADATNDLDIATGGAMDATNTYWMDLTSALTKQSDVAWAVGNNAGGLDTGAVGNNDYYIWLIARSDTGVVDVLFSLSSTAPTMPANYDFKRLIGWFKRVGGTIVAFTTDETAGGGLELLWTTPTLDINLANTLTTARRTDAVKVPLNFSVLASLNVQIGDATTPANAIIYCPDHSDLTPSATVAPLSSAAFTTSYGFLEHMYIKTSATGQIAARSTLATVDIYQVVTLGFTWARRN